MKSESNRAFSTIDTLTLIGSVMIVTLIVGPIISRRINQQQSVRAAQLAQEWTEKIPLDENLSGAGLRASLQRDVASNPENQTKVGSDPWGHPYHYQYIHNSYGQPVYLAVWSSGPNSENETMATSLKITGEGTLSASFLGDDVGIVRSLR